MARVAHQNFEQLSLSLVVGKLTGLLLPLLVQRANSPQRENIIRDLAGRIDARYNDVQAAIGSCAPQRARGK